MLYSGDQNGILRILNIEQNIEKKLSINLRNQLETKSGAILSALIFFDKYKELDYHETVFDTDKLKIGSLLSFCYIMVTTSDKSILLYKNTNNYYNEENWVLYRRIQMETKTTACYKIDFFYDEILKKTKFYFGFSEKYIANYDLQTCLKKQT